MRQKLAWFALVLVTLALGVYHAELPVVFQDRLKELRVLFRVTTCVFPEPGSYQVTLFLDGDWIAQRGIRIVLTEK
jgi:hypothetical protein